MGKGKESGEFVHKIYIYSYIIYIMILYQFSDILWHFENSHHTKIGST